jgi:hypothetical protein
MEDGRISVWHMIDVDLARAYASETKDGFVRAVGWGDGGKVLDVIEKHVEVTEVDLLQGHEGGEPGLCSEVLKVPPIALTSTQIAVRPT